MYTINVEDLKSFLSLPDVLDKSKLQLRFTGENSILSISITFKISVSTQFMFRLGASSSSTLGNKHHLERIIIPRHI